MRILSIHDGHNASALLLEDGVVKFAIQEERLTKIKNYMGFPKKSIDMIMKRFQLSPKDIDLVVFSTVHMPKPFDVRKIREVFKKTSRNRLTNHIKRTIRKTPLYSIMYSKRNGDRIKPLLKIGFTRKQIKFVDHHTSHAYSAYFGSPWWKTSKKVLVMTLDGGGDRLCATVWIGQDDELKKISETTGDHSIGHIYSRTTFMLGLKPWEHEYKVMGLAPYPDKKYSLSAYKKFTSYRLE